MAVNIRLGPQGEYVVALKVASKVLTFEANKGNSGFSFEEPAIFDLGSVAVKKDGKFNCVSSQKEENYAAADIRYIAIEAVSTVPVEMLLVHCTKGEEGVRSLYSSPFTYTSQLVKSTESEQAQLAELRSDSMGFCSNLTSFNSGENTDSIIRVNNIVVETGCEAADQHDQAIVTLTEQIAAKKKETPTLRTALAVATKAGTTKPAEQEAAKKALQANTDELAKLEKELRSAKDAYVSLANHRDENGYGLYVVVLSSVPSTDAVGLCLTATVAFSDAVVHETGDEDDTDVLQGIYDMQLFPNRGVTKMTRSEWRSTAPITVSELNKARGSAQKRKLEQLKESFIPGSKARALENPKVRAGKN